MVSDEELKRLERLVKKMRLYIRGWNEQELRERFIIPVVELVDFDMYDLKIASFAERDLKAEYNNAILQGKVEWMVARGIFAPKEPFFFIHEYKKEKNAANDPLGQLLVTLCTAQLLNQKTPDPTLFNAAPKSFEDIPLYGVYILGRFWFFVRLKNREYYVSKAYNAEEMKDLIFIVQMLKAQKKMVIDLVQNLN